MTYISPLLRSLPLSPVIASANHSLFTFRGFFLASPGRWGVSKQCHCLIMEKVSSATSNPARIFVRLPFPNHFVRKVEPSGDSIATAFLRAGGALPLSFATITIQCDTALHPPSSGCFPCHRYPTPPLPPIPVGIALRLLYSPPQTVPSFPATTSNLVFFSLSVSPCVLPK
jgi:hypothetical protein